MPRVLVVDDDQYLREAVRTLLEEDGYEVIEAPHGAAALDVLRGTKEPLIVLLDVLNLARSDEQLARHAFVIWTASRAPVPTELTTELGVPVVSKPFDLEGLLAVIARAGTRVRQNVLLDSER
jgi:CheY-like chemotaxis protein